MYVQGEACKHLGLAVTQVTQGQVEQRGGEEEVKGGMREGETKRLLKVDQSER